MVIDSEARLNAQLAIQGMEHVKVGLERHLDECGKRSSRTTAKLEQIDTDSKASRTRMYARIEDLSDRASKQHTETMTKLTSLLSAHDQKAAHGRIKFLYWVLGIMAVIVLALGKKVLL